MRVRDYLLAAALALSAFGCAPNAQNNQEQRISQLEQRLVKLEKENVELKQKVENKNVSESYQNKTEEKKIVAPDKFTEKERNLFDLEDVKFKLSGKFQTGVIYIDADRASGNEQTAFYKLDLQGDVNLDKDFGLLGRIVVEPPVCRAAREYKEYDELNPDFELRELYIYKGLGIFGKISLGKVKVPNGIDNFEEDRSWSEPLLEGRLGWFGRYDIGARLDKEWENDFYLNLALTSGNYGELDNNSAGLVAANIGKRFEIETENKPFIIDVGFGGRYNRVNTTPIKQDDEALWGYLQLERNRWRIFGKAACLRQGYRVDFNLTDIAGYGYDDSEAEEMVWEVEHGEKSRNFWGWYAGFNIPILRNLDLTATYGQLLDNDDPFETKRDRISADLIWAAKENKRTRFFIFAGGAFDNEEGNNRYYLYRIESLNSRNGGLSFHGGVGISF